MRSRLATTFATLALLGGFGGALAVAHADKHPNHNGGAADDQYRPGKGCGDENHKHARESECKHHHGDTGDHGRSGHGD